MRWFRQATFLFGLLSLLVGTEMIPQATQKATEEGNPTPILLRGKVLDLQTGEPIAKALVSIRDQKLEAVTDAFGQFQLSGVRPVEVELYVTTVGYGLVRKKIQLLPGRDAELELFLGQEALKQTTEITVTAGVFDPIEPGAASEVTLNNSEMKNLGSVLADDPLRAVQALPGVAAGDDFNAQFALRGSGFAYVGYYIDGVLTNSPFHTIQDLNDSGSLTILNGDLVESVSLLSGGFPSKYGDRKAAILNMQTRSGSREKVYTRVNAGFTGLSATSEGPLGESKKASWLVSARKSYVDYLISRISEDPTFAIGLWDVQGKLTYNPVAQHQLDLSLIHGMAKLDREHWADRLGVNTTEKGSSRSDILSLNWGWTPAPSTHLQTVAYLEKEAAHNYNKNGEFLFEQNASQFGLRQDVSHQFRTRHRLEGGYFLRRLSEDQMRNRFDYGSNDFITLNSYDCSSVYPGGYLQDHWSAWANKLFFTFGVRFDRINYTGENVVLPRLGFQWNLSGRSKLSGAYGVYSQFPSFTQFAGEFRGENLVAERSRHLILAFEQTLTDKVRIRVEGYDQKEISRIFSPQTQYRLVNGIITPPLYGDVLENSAHGYSRGVEFFLQRRSANRLSGWISYSLGYARLTDSLSGLRFYTDQDQRHTFNAYGSYRFTKTWNLSAKYRYGSNFPISGFYRQQGDKYFLDSRKNEVRVPAYGRLDLRVNKGFYFQRWKLTLYGEVANVFDRKNYRYVDIRRINYKTNEVTFQRDSLMPILPTVGVTLEF
jgi:hypothetical protein